MRLQHHFLTISKLIGKRSRKMGWREMGTVKTKWIAASLLALLIIVLYILGQLVIGLIQTFLYRPQFAPDDFILQSEISFGGPALHSSPLALVGGYCILTLLLLIVFTLKKKGVDKID